MGGRGLPGPVGFTRASGGLDKAKNRCLGPRGGSTHGQSCSSLSWDSVFRTNEEQRGARNHCCRDPQSPQAQKCNHGPRLPVRPLAPSPGWGGPASDQKARETPHPPATNTCSPYCPYSRDSHPRPQQPRHFSRKPSLMPTLPHGRSAQPNHTALRGLGGPAPQGLAWRRCWAERSAPWPHEHSPGGAVWTMGTQCTACRGFLLAMAVPSLPLPWETPECTRRAVFSGEDSSGQLLPAECLAGAVGSKEARATRRWGIPRPRDLHPVTFLDPGQPLPPWGLCFQCLRDEAVLARAFCLSIHRDYLQARTETQVRWLVNLRNPDFPSL